MFFLFSEKGRVNLRVSGRNKINTKIAQTSNNQPIVECILFSISGKYPVRVVFRTKVFDFDDEINVMEAMTKPNIIPAKVDIADAIG